MRVREAVKEALHRLRPEDPNEDKSNEHCRKPQFDQPRPERPSRSELPLPAAQIMRGQVDGNHLSSDPTWYKKQPEHEPRSTLNLGLLSLTTRSP